VEDNPIVDNRAGVANDGNGGGINIFYSTPTLNRNQVLSNTARYGGGIYVFRLGPVTLTNNIIAQNHAVSEGGGIRFRGLSSTELAYGTLLHNTIAENDQEGIYLDQYAVLTLTNNIIVSHTTGIYAGSSTTVTADYTLFFGNSVGDTGGLGSIISTNEITGSDPLFVDPAGWDYHLQAGSPAIDRGVDAGVTTDIDGEARPNGLGYDIGADEFYCYALTGITITGPVTGTTGVAYAFTATIAPPTATLPITYTWSPEPDAGQSSSVVTYTWAVTEP
jgi:hypothetical protein